MVVICMGANDPQDIIDENRKRHHADSESWKTIYRSRAERLLAVATAKGAKAVWVGLPVMGKEPYSTRVRRLSELQKEACETYHAAFVDTVKVLADAQGNYTTFKVDDKGRHVRLRYKDMVACDRGRWSHAVRRSGTCCRKGTSSWQEQGGGTSRASGSAFLRIFFSPTGGVPFARRR